MVIEISCEVEEANEFVDWLKGMGYDVKVGCTTGTFIDGENINSSHEKDSLFQTLWEDYCERI